MTVVDQVRGWIARAGVPPDGARVVVGCSGGADSTALLCALAALRRFRLHAVYVDHGLRAGTELEARHVAALATRVGASWERIAVRVARPGNLLAAARVARYEALAAAARRLDGAWVAVGHTRSDQAETVLFRAARGDVAHGLAGMAGVRALDDQVRLLRPLLEVGREAAAGLAREFTTPLDDPSNARREFTRVRIRAALAEMAGAEERLAALAGQVALQVAALDRAAAALGPLDDLDVVALAALDDGLLLRLLRRAAVLRAGGRHVALLRSLCGSVAGTRRIDLGSGCVAERRYDRLRFLAAASRDPPAPVTVAAPGVFGWEDGSVVVSEAARSLLAAPQPGWLLRSRRPGDRLRTRAGRRKLHDVFIDRKVPRLERDRVPLLATAAGEVLWVGGVGTAFSPTASAVAPLADWFPGAPPPTSAVASTVDSPTVRAIMRRDCDVPVQPAVEGSASNATN